MTTTDGSRSISSYMACLMASRKVTCVGASLLEFFGRAVEVLAMGSPRPFFAALLTGLAAVFLADFGAGFGFDLPTAFPVTGATTFAMLFNEGPILFMAAFWGG